jgi:PTS system nitrogen regulatory IIA component
MSEENFDIDSLATYLHLTPAQVRKMADRGKLPGRRINDQWKFSRAEIHHWFENRIGLSDEVELKEVEQVLHTNAQRNQTSQVSILDLLQEHTITIPLMARTKSSAIDGICQFAADSGTLWDPNKMKEAIRARESLHPTALENGVALLHPRRPMPNVMEDSFLALGVTTSGIPFGGPRGVLTDIFFLVCSASDAEHLQILARLSRLVSQAELLNDIRESESAAKVRELIGEAEASLTD